MAISPNSFAKKLKAFANDLPKQQNEIKKAFAKEALLQIVPDTPVDTGQARSNWNVKLGSRDTSFLLAGPFTKGGDNAINRGHAVINTAKPDDKIFFSNNLPYIGRLNEGYSRQAPRNYVQQALRRARGILKRQKIRYKV